MSVSIAAMSQLRFVLEWKLTDELKEVVRNATDKYWQTTAKLDCNYMQYRKFGKNQIKKHKLSPDSFMQLAFQVVLPGDVSTRAVND